MENVRYFANFVSLGFSIYLWIHIAAILLTWIRADRNNWLVQAINTLTQPLWNWAGIRLPVRLSYMAPYAAILIVLFGEIFVPGLILSVAAGFLHLVEPTSAIISLVVYGIYGGVSVIYEVVHFIIFLAMFWFFLSLVNPPLNNPIVQSIMLIIDPMITPLQRILPRSAIDLSPLALALISFLLGRVLSTFGVMLKPYLIY